MSGLRERPGEKGESFTGPNPTDRGKLGTKYHVLTDRDGLPLHIELSGANTHDSMLVEPVLDNMIPVKGVGRGRHRRRPGKFHADKAYDNRRIRTYLRRRGITARIARRGIEPKERLGKHRWVVERTMSWMHGYRKLTPNTTDPAKPSPPSRPSQSPSHAPENYF